MGRVLDTLVAGAAEQAVGRLASDRWAFDRWAADVSAYRTFGRLMA